MSKGKKGDTKKRLKLKDIKFFIKKVFIMIKLIIFIMLFSLASNFLHEMFARPVENVEFLFQYDEFKVKGSCSFYESESSSAQNVD